MSIDDRVIELIEEGNPVVDPDSFARERIRSAAYLALLQTRSSEMEQTHHDPDPDVPRSRRSIWLAVGAAAVVVAVFGYAVTRGDSEGDPTDQVSPATATTAAEDQDVSEATTIPESTQESTAPESFDLSALAGTWSGEVVQDGEFSAWAEITISEGGERNSAVADVIFRTSEDAPTIFCEGSWLVRGATPPTYEMFENFPADSACDDGAVTLTHDPETETLEYIFDNGAYQTVGTLDRMPG